MWTVYDATSLHVDFFLALRGSPYTNEVGHRTEMETGQGREMLQNWTLRTNTSLIFMFGGGQQMDNLLFCWCTVGAEFHLIFI